MNEELEEEEEEEKAFPNMLKENIRATNVKKFIQRLKVKFKKIRTKS